VATIPSPPTAPGTVTAPILARAPVAATLNSSTIPLPPVCTYRNRPPAASTAPGSVAVLPSRLSCPPAASAKPLSAGVPALEANRNDPAVVTQQVAACPVATCWSKVTVPLRLRPKVASALGPASAMTRWPNGSKAIANGTVPGSLFTV
jgi:hypothetical protein